MPLELPGTLLLAGAGNMGGALLKGWLDQGLDPRRIIVQDPSPPPAIFSLLQTHGITAEAVPQVAAPPAVIVVAVKPQVMDQVFPGIARHAGPDTVVLSVAAGKTIASFEKHLAKGIAVVLDFERT